MPLILKKCYLSRLLVSRAIRSSGRVARMSIIEQVNFSLRGWNHGGRAFVPLCLLPRMHPLPLQWQAPLRIFSLTRTCPTPLCLHICLQALCPSTRFCDFPPLRSGARLRLLPLLVPGPPASEVLGLKYCPIPSHVLSWDSPACSFPGLPRSTCQKKEVELNYLNFLCLFFLHQSVNIFPRLFYFAEYKVLTARLVNTKLLGFCLLWDVTVYVIGCQNCPTPGNHCSVTKSHLRDFPTPLGNHWTM